MWVNQKTDLPVVQPEEKRMEEVEELRPLPGGAPREATEMDVHGLTAAKKETPRFDKAVLPGRDCLFLMTAYLLGTFLAGVAVSRCNAGETETLSYYLACWQRLFSVGSAAEAAGLFRTEFFTLAGALAVLLCLGLSALGPFPIFLFVLLYGTGSGLLSLQWTMGQEPIRLLLLSAVCGIPSALAAGAVCIFGTSAIQVSGRLCSAAFGRGGQAPGAGVLFRQFARMLFLLLPLCGGAVGMLYLVGQKPG